MPESTELTVFEPQTGELVKLKEASDEALAAWVTDRQEEREAMGAAERLVSDELVDRLDHQVQWTRTVHDETTGRVWEIKAPSPTAGSEVYPPDMLETELRALVERGAIADTAAESALKRTVTVKLSVPLNADLAETAKHIQHAMTFKAGDVQLEVLSVDGSAVPVKAGINALRKVPGTNAALDRARRTEPVGDRRAKVTLKTDPRDRRTGEETTR